MTIERIPRDETKCSRVLCPLDSQWVAAIRVMVWQKDATEGKWALLASSFQACDDHQPLTELRHFLTDVDKRTLTDQCEERGHPLPDWDTAVIEWVRLPPVAERGSAAG